MMSPTFLLLIFNLLALSFCVLQASGSGAPAWNLIAVNDDTDIDFDTGSVEDQVRTSRQRRRTKDDQDKSSEEDYDESQIQMQALAVKNRRAPAPLPANNHLQLPPGYSIYDISKEPSGAAIPLFIHIHIKKILDFDEINSRMKLDIELVILWTDFEIMYYNSMNDTRTNRSRFYVDDMSEEERRQKRVTLNNPDILAKIWKPNLFIENLLSVRQPTIMARPLTVKFIPEAGAFEYITRLAVTIDCEMDFHFYPADTQVCDFSIRGFSYVRTDLSMNWYRNGVYLDTLHLPSFDVKVDDVTKYDWRRNDEATEIFEMLAFKIYARRRLSYHLVQTYLASMFYIIITCLCFLLPARLTEARIGVAMTALLTLTAMFGSVRESTPIVSYVKAIDIWMVCCIFFVFLALAQITFHTWFRCVKQDCEEAEQKLRKLHEESIAQKMSRRNSDSASGKPAEDTSGIEIDVENAELNPEMLIAQVGRKKSFMEAILSKNTLKKYENYDRWINQYSYVLFMSLFLTFCAAYWTILLTQAEYFDWKVNPKLNQVLGSRRQK